MNAQQIDPKLKSMIVNAFSVARWAYGAQAVGEDLEESPPTILLISKDADSYSFRGLDDRGVTHKEGRLREEEVADECVRLMVWGFTDYILTVQECAMFVGDGKETEAFRALLSEKGDMFDPSLSGEIKKCCSFALYDLSGIIVRTFATDLCCIRTFMMNSEVEDLFPSMADHWDSAEVLPLDDTRISSDVSDLSQEVWVYDENVPANLKDVGPLPSWSKSLTRVLEEAPPMGDQ